MQVAEFTYNSATFLNLNKDIFYLLDCLLLFTLWVYSFHGVVIKVFIQTQWSQL